MTIFVPEENSRRSDVDREQDQTEIEEKLNGDSKIWGKIEDCCEKNMKSVVFQRFWDLF